MKAVDISEIRKKTSVDEPYLQYSKCSQSIAITVEKLFEGSLICFCNSLKVPSGQNGSK